MSRKYVCLVTVLLAGMAAWAQQVSEQDLSTEEAAAVAAILAKHNATHPASADPETIILPPATKQEAFEQASQASDSVPVTPPTAPQELPTPDASATCLPVAFVDIDVAFNEHPRTIEVKKQIRLKILAKEEEVEGAKQLITVLRQENEALAAQGRALKPFYERIVIEPTPLLPRVQESADTLLLSNLLNRLTFSRTEILTHAPLNTPARLEEIKARISANKKIIAERSLFIDNYKYTTREEILTLEKKEVNEILQDIYTEIKSFAQKRNIGVVVRKDEILYGASPVNVTKDFVNRLKKSRKYRKSGK